MELLLAIHAVVSSMFIQQIADYATWRSVGECDTQRAGEYRKTINSICAFAEPA